ncbi:MAG: transcription termination factor Rho [Chloroflexota bacterium]
MAPDAGQARLVHVRADGDPSGLAVSMGHSFAELQLLEDGELRRVACDLGLAADATARRTDLVGQILQRQAELQGNIFAGGLLDVIADGHGFLRKDRFLPGANDVYVSQSQIKRIGLRIGDWVTGQIRAPKETERYFSMLRVEAVNGEAPERACQRPAFDALVPVFPSKHLALESGRGSTTERLIDLVAPIGRGQRGLIVSPPKAGKTTMLKEVANSIGRGYPDVHLMAVLVGERPEEVTDFRRSVRAEVVSSTFDETAESHVTVAEMALHRARRLVEAGRDVVMLLDSITRLARAYNIAAPSSGRTLSGGIDPVALYPAKRFFGAARNTEDGGSLTILATCLVDTGSRMDDVIFEEFKGTGNLELHLDRRLAEKGVFPAIDVQRSGTRRDDLLLGSETLARVRTMRRMLAQIGSGDCVELVLARLNKTRSNREFLETLAEAGV